MEDDDKTDERPALSPASLQPRTPAPLSNTTNIYCSLSCTRLCVYSCELCMVYILCVRLCFVVLVCVCVCVIIPISTRHLLRAGWSARQGGRRTASSSCPLHSSQCVFCYLFIPSWVSATGILAFIVLVAATVVSNAPSAFWGGSEWCHIERHHTSQTSALSIKTTNNAAMRLQCKAQCHSTGLHSAVESGVCQREDFIFPRYRHVNVAINPSRWVGEGFGGNGECKRLVIVYTLARGLIALGM
jgi:hypothetical protein